MPHTTMTIPAYTFGAAPVVDDTPRFILRNAGLLDLQNHHPPNMFRHLVDTSMPSGRVCWSKVGEPPCAVDRDGEPWHDRPVYR